MKTLAITGGIACGKSLVGRLLRDRGFPVCETDELGHFLLEKKSPVFELVVAEFGAGILGPDGGIDRSRLAHEVFADDDRRIQLNRLLHPHICQLWRQWLSEREAAQVRLCAVIIPLMYEAGLDENWTAVICVAAPQAAQAERMRGRGWTEADAAARVRAQWPLALKMERANYVIYNGGAVDLAAEQLDRILKTV